MANSNNQWVINYFKQLEQQGIIMEAEKQVKPMSEMQQTIEHLSETLYETRLIFERITNVAMRIKPISPDAAKGEPSQNLTKEPEGHLEALQDQVYKQVKNNKVMIQVIEHLEKYAG